MKLIIDFLLILSLILFTGKISAQYGGTGCGEATCNYGDRGGANCHQFVKNYFERGYDLDHDLVCNYNNLTSQQRNIIYNCSQGYTIQWPGFYNTYLERANSWDDAEVISYEEDGLITHSAVILHKIWTNNGVLISKWESNGPVVKHNMFEIPNEYYTCGNSRYSYSYWKWKDTTTDPDPPCNAYPSSTTITGSHNRRSSGSSCLSSSLYSFNQVCGGQISVTLNSVSGVTYKWKRTGGSAYYTASSNGRKANIYLYSGSATFLIEPYNSCGEKMDRTPRSVVFSVSGGSGGPFFAVGSEQPSFNQQTEVRDMFGNLILKIQGVNREEVIRNLEAGIYIIQSQNTTDGTVVKEKVVIR